GRAAYSSRQFVAPGSKGVLAEGPMRTLVIALAVMLVGCAPVPSRSWEGADADADWGRCRAASDDKEPGALAKTGIYASNMLVVPISTVLTLGFETVYVHPLSGDEAREYYFGQCMRNLGYGPITPSDAPVVVPGNCPGNTYWNGAGCTSR